MIMQKFATLGAALALATISVNTAANSITMQEFTIGDFNAATATSGFSTIEDFESYSQGAWANGTETSVGTFSVFGDLTGTGSVCQAQTGGNCQTLAINDTERSGQGNLYPANGTTALSSNDTQGMSWTAYDRDGGSAFDTIVFALRDAADIRNTIFTVAAGELSSTLTSQANNNEQLVIISLGERVTSAVVSMFNSGRNDGFTIDAASILATPLPAAGWLMLSALAGLGVISRRKKASA